jgi:hypothetical protein
MKTEIDSEYKRLCLPLCRREVSFWERPVALLNTKAVRETMWCTSLFKVGGGNSR